ncbi:MAG: DEAD/DEAH box helicase, partial [Candidatus Saccharimonadales bacterium]|nr:DEAD/DEAH box helicase [Candidatus Saccharimonadales bacterium]
MNLETPISVVKGVGSAVEQKLARLGISTVGELIYHFPRRYQDYSKITSTSELEPGPVTVRVRFKNISGRYVRRGLHITQATGWDDKGEVRVTWFNQPYRAKQLSTKPLYLVSGEYGFGAGRYSITNPACEKESAFPKNTARIIPIYPETKGLKSHSLRKMLANLLSNGIEMEETVPAIELAKHNLMGIGEALTEVHFPSSADALTRAKYRLGFNELLELALAGELNRRDIADQKGAKIKYQQPLADKFIKALPFTLTDTQKRSAWEVLKDIDSHEPMNRLLEGDVGSGKTIVAAMAAIMALKAGYQVAYMAPTEILARQQVETLRELMVEKTEVQLLLGSDKAKDKKRLREELVAGKVQLIVGTHSLIQEEIAFKNLGLIVIDEQHRFGVAQRQKILSKASVVPHVLTMTATPIPRTLALIIYGELDISIIDELPEDRKPIITEIYSP